MTRLPSPWITRRRGGSEGGQDCAPWILYLVGAIPPLVSGADDGVERRSCPRGSTLRHVDHPRITPLELPRAWLALDGRLLHASLRPCDDRRVVP